MGKRLLLVVCFISWGAGALFSLQYEGKIHGGGFEGDWSIAVTPNQFDGGDGDALITHVNRIDFGFNMSFDENGFANADVKFGVNDQTRENVARQHQHATTFTVSLNPGPNPMHFFFTGVPGGVFDSWDKYIVVYYYPPAVTLTLTTANGIPYNYVNGDSVFGNWLPPTINNSAVVSRKLTVANTTPPGNTVTYLVNRPDISSGSGSFTEFIDGDYIVSFRTVDRIGNVHDLSYRVKMDTEAPFVSISAPGSLWAQSPGGANASWSVWVVDRTSGVVSTHTGYTIGYSPTPLSNPSLASYSPTLTPLFQAHLPPGQPSTATVSPSFSRGEGYYYLKVTAVDAVFIERQVYVPIPVKWDYTPPILTAPALSITNQGGILVQWTTASDSMSGIQSTSASYSTLSNPGQVFPLVDVVVTGNQSSATIPYSESILNQQIVVQLKATNNAGLNSSASAQIYLPQKLDIVPTVNMSASTTALMQVELQFNLSAADLKQGYSTIVVGRTTTTSGFQLPSFTIDTSTIALNGTELVSDPTWGQRNGKVYYINRIPTSTGAGNKTWLYSFASTPSLGTISSANVDLPNHTGSVTISISDTEGNSYLTDPTQPLSAQNPVNPNFHVYSNGKLQISFIATDPDQDHWAAEVDKVRQIRSGSSLISSYVSLSGPGLIACDYVDPTGYAQKTVEVTLGQGSNKVCISWKEGSAAEFNHSQILVIELNTLPAVDGFQISVRDLGGADLDSEGTSIVAQPGQPLLFSVSTLEQVDESEYDWTFGDGVSGQGSTISHTYSQALNQATDSTTYNLGLVVRTTSITLPIVIRDTREGSLYTSETWRGPHTVVGVVKVLPTQTLTIAPTAVVRFSGGVGGGYGQGLDIASGAFLDIADGAQFKKVETQSEGWGTILVSGTATIGSADIADADRGITVANGATATLTGTVLHNNITGLHLAGPSTTSVQSSQIENNSLYGIKEELGGRPVVKNSSILGNLRNYYQWDVGLIDIAAINALGTNSGNQGE